jgi:cyclopropane fatty-acyl-phospholipid synthase-like methyltransferase
MTKPGFSEACERNKDVILSNLMEVFSLCTTVLEIGSGTGQHVVHFSRALPGVHWQPADTHPYLPGLRSHLEAAAPANVSPAVELDVRDQPWPVAEYDGVYSANTLHYMGEDCVEAFFNGVGQVLQPGGILVVYGPFRYAGKYTSESNARFDEFLHKSDAVRGIRDFEWIDELASRQDLGFVRDVPMPANNQLLVWRKTIDQ